MCVTVAPDLRAVLVDVLRRWFIVMSRSHMAVDRATRWPDLDAWASCRPRAPAVPVRGVGEHGSAATSHTAASAGAPPLRDFAGVISPARPMADVMVVRDGG